MATTPLNFYVSTLHEPDAVLSSTVSSLLSPRSADFIFKYPDMRRTFINLIYSKGTRLEVCNFIDRRMTPVLNIPIDGRIVLLKSFRPQVCDSWY